MRIFFILIALAALHILFQTNLTSPVLFPLAAAYVLSTLPNRVSSLFVLGIISEFFSVLPSGIMFMAVLTPLLFQLFIKKIAPRFSWSFLGLTTLITFLQLAWIVSFDFVRNGIEGIALPTTIWVFLGTTIASFLGAAIWHEYE